MAEVGSYLYLAKKDLISANQIKTAGDTGLYSRLCEQAVEKALKHFILLHGNPSDIGLLSTHKPMRLYKRCNDLNLKLELSKDDLIILSQLDDYYFDTNYPGNGWFEPEREDVDLAYELANKIVKHVENLLKS